MLHLSDLLSLNSVTLRRVAVIDILQLRTHLPPTSLRRVFFLVLMDLDGEAALTLSLRYRELTRHGVLRSSPGWKEGAITPSLSFRP